MKITKKNLKELILEQLLGEMSEVGEIPDGIVDEEMSQDMETRSLSIVTMLSDIKSEAMVHTQLLERILAALQQGGR
tara:strand:- start:1468 stop:1698 length:231 start_codon:yes stop_codon:yes gene_type:complete